MTKRVKESVTSTGGLYRLGWYLSWDVGDKAACLDGYFSADDLRAIADHMDASKGPAGEVEAAE